MSRARCCILGSMLLVLVGSPASGQVEYGLAAGYPHDLGIEADPAVVFREDFEEASMDDLLARWEDVMNPEQLSFDADRPPASGGQQSLFFDGVAELYRRLLPGYEQLYVRLYAKFDTACTNVHHWVWMGGHNPSTSWPWPRAGERPVGDERWSTGIEPMGTSWAWDFYTYWMHMRTNPDTRYWGNTFSGRPSPYPAVKGQWVCVELMVKMNAPVGSYNGEQAFWIDGEKKNHLGLGFPVGEWVWDGFYPGPGGQPFEGFQWRTVPELDINYLWLEHYVDTDPGCRVRMDDVVVATAYIGPMVSDVPGDGGVAVDAATSADAPAPRDAAGSADGAAPRDAVGPAEGGAGRDAPGAAGDAEVDARDHPAGAAGVEGGCGCSAQRRPAGALLALVAALAVLALRRRAGRRAGARPS